MNKSFQILPTKITEFINPHNVKLGLIRGEFNSGKTSLLFRICLSYYCAGYDCYFIPFDNDMDFLLRKFHGLQNLFQNNHNILDFLPLNCFSDFENRIYDLKGKYAVFIDNPLSFIDNYFYENYVNPFKRNLLIEKNVPKQTKIPENEIVNCYNYKLARKLFQILYVYPAPIFCAIGEPTFLQLKTTIDKLTQESDLYIKLKREKNNLRLKIKTDSFEMQDVSFDINSIFQNNF